jgi:HK97 gp10 family phage protein
VPVPGNVTFHFDASRTTDQLLAMTKALRSRVTARAMYNALEPMHTEAVNRVPVDTGALRQGIIRQVRQYANGLRIQGLVGASRGRKKIRPGKTWRWLGPVRVSRYAHLVENGGPHFAAQPFLRPAADHGVYTVPARFARELDSILAAVH